MQKNNAYVLLVEPKMKPKIIQIEDSEQAIKDIVGGEVDRIKIPSDDVTILFQKDGVINGKTLNRVVEFNEEKETEMSYSELTSMFRKAEDEGKHIGGYITFTEDSFDKIYPLESRTYGVSSNNKAFRSGMGGYSIYGSSLDRTDMNVRLERYMYNEYGGADGWKIERCYIKETGPINDVISDDEPAPANAENESAQKVDDTEVEETENPFSERTENPLSEKNSTDTPPLSDKGTVDKDKKPSVKEKLNELKKEINKQKSDKSKTLDVGKNEHHTPKIKNPKER